MTITKRNGKYYCRFQLNGERHHYLCSGATSKSEAEKIENAFKYKLQQQQNGVIPREDNIKLSKLYKAYLDYSILNKKSCDRDIQRVQIIKNIWKNKLYAKDIKPIDLEELKNTLLMMGRSKQTVNKYLQLISKMFNIGIDNMWISVNPVKKISKFKTQHQQVRYLEEVEEKALFRYANKYWKGVLLVALHTGLRLSNIRLLQGKNINLDFRILDITENKGNKHIKLYLNDVLYKFFKTFEFKEDDYIFTIDGKPLNMNRFQREWKNLKKMAGIEKLRFHDLRHTVGTRLAKRGVPINVIKEIMAHSSISTTMQYVHTASNQMKEAMEVL